MTDTLAATATPSAIDRIADAYWEEALALNPLAATVYGDRRYDDRLPDPSQAGRQAEIDALRRAVAAADAVDEPSLSTEDRITRDMLRVLLELAERDEALHAYRAREVDPNYGPQGVLQQVAVFQPADTPEALDAWLARLHAFGPFIDAHIGILAEGRASGLTASRIVADRAIAQLRRLLDTPLEQDVIAQLSRVASDADRERVRAVVGEVVRPAARRYLEALEGDWYAATREVPGLHAAPGGAELYRHEARRWTTLDMDPRDIHQVGLEEYASIDEERRVLARRAGYGDDVHAWRRALYADPANLPATEAALLAHIEEMIDRAGAVAPRVFGRLPRAACIVRPVESFKQKDAPPAYYYPPTLDGSRPGTYYLNTGDLPSMALHKLAAYTYHEAIPGHHFQISLEMEHPGLNAFRRLGARAIGGAYVEGWGLYAERLADELGLYRDDAERLGMLDAQAWRAARLIVDSGLHGLGWTREQAVEQMLDAGLSETDASIETDRYIAWPGQALSYMTGMREIRRLRRELEARDGDRFDLTAFHDELIGHGTLPLVTLATELPRWVRPKG